MYHGIVIIQTFLLLETIDGLDTLQMSDQSVPICLGFTRGSKWLPSSGDPFVYYSSDLVFSFRPLLSFFFVLSKGEEKPSPIENTDATSQDAIFHGRWCYIDFAMAS